nr:MAG TPA: hypothetical protein [Caudoviricetes sp.]
MYQVFPFYVPSVPYLCTKCSLFMYLCKHKILIFKSLQCL